MAPIATGDPGARTIPLENNKTRGHVCGQRESVSLALPAHGTLRIFMWLLKARDGDADDPGRTSMPLAGKPTVAEENAKHTVSVLPSPDVCLRAGVVF